MTRVRYAIPESHTLPSGGGMIRPGKRGGGHSGRDTPGPFPFPNPEAKTASADGTAPARVWESRTPPPAHHKGGPATGPPLFSHTRPATHTHTPATPAMRHTHTHGHTRKHSMSTQVDAVGYKTCV